MELEDELRFREPVDFDGLLSPSQALYGHWKHAEIRRCVRLLERARKAKIENGDTLFLTLVTRNFIADGVLPDMAKLKAAAERVRQQIPTSLLDDGGKYQELKDKMRFLGVSVRRKMYIQRLSCEVVDMVNCGGTIVMNTLTADSNHISKVFVRDSKYWKSYREKVDNRFGKHHYFGVIERGGKHGRLHYHVLHFFPFELDIPDTNWNKKVPGPVPVMALKECWNAGRSDPFVIRWAGDCYSARGWAWPHREVKGELVSVPASAYSVVGYCAKYLADEMVSLRGFNTPKKENDPWRIKISNNLGSRWIDQALRELEPAELAQVVRAPENPRTDLLRRWVVERARKMLAEKLVASPDLLKRFIMADAPPNFWNSVQSWVNPTGASLERMNSGPTGAPVWQNAGIFDAVAFVESLCEPVVSMMQVQYGGSPKGRLL